MKKCNTLKFINISFVPSKSHLLFNRKKVCLLNLLPQKIYFSTIFDFHFREENPRFRDEFQALST